MHRCKTIREMNSDSNSFFFHKLKIVCWKNFKIAMETFQIPKQATNVFFPWIAKINFPEATQYGGENYFFFSGKQFLIFCFHWRALKAGKWGESFGHLELS